MIMTFSSGLADGLPARRDDSVMIIAKKGGVTGQGYGMRAVHGGTSGQLA
jgi:hypothetical protein